MEIEVGDVFWMEVTYPENSVSEVRPVVIFGFDYENPLIASFATITGSKIRNPHQGYDRWKSPILKWKRAGLSKPSYVKANNIATVDKEVFSKNDYIGKMHRFDLKRAILKINKFIKSGEDPW